MSNTIKLKRGSKSNLPTLNVGEPAFTTDTNDLYVGNGTSNVKFAKDSDINSVYTTTNSGNIYSVTIPNITSLDDGHLYVVKFNAASTGAVTLNINSLGAKSIIDYSGSAVTDVRANLIVNLRYEANTGSFILQGKGGDSGTVMGAETSVISMRILTNLISNGDFNTGTAYRWGSPTNGGTMGINTSITKFNSNSMYVTGSTSYTETYFGYSGVPYIQGHKYYCSAWAYSDTAGKSAQIYWPETSPYPSTQVTCTNANTWYQMAYISSDATIVSGNYSFRLDNNNSSSASTIYYDGILCVDLTSAYGAGYEPTLAQMNVLVSSLGDWFDGSVVINKITAGNYSTTGTTGATELYIPSTMSNVGSDPVSYSAPVLYNILDNGSFESTYNWTSSVLSTTYKKYGTYSNKMLSASTSSAINVGQRIPLFSGHKYYTSGWFLRDGSITQPAQFDITSISPEMDTSSLDNGTLPTIGAWYRLSAINSSPVTGPGNLRAYSFDATTSIYMDGFVCIDLTACFGSGYEPTKAQMDNLMTSIGGWFTGAMIVNQIYPGVYTATGTTGTTEVLTGKGEMINRQFVGDDFLNSSYPTLRFNKGGDVQYGSYGTESPANRLAICPPQGYYPGSGNAYVTAEASEVASAIGLDASKMLTTLTASGVTGTIANMTSAINFGNADSTCFTSSASLCGGTATNSYVGAFDIYVPAGYYNGTGTNRIHIPNLIPANIKSGVQVGWSSGYITGTYSAASALKYATGTIAAGGTADVGFTIIALYSNEYGMLDPSGYSYDNELYTASHWSYDVKFTTGVESTMGYGTYVSSASHPDYVGNYQTNCYVKISGTSGIVSTASTAWTYWAVGY